MALSYNKFQKLLDDQRRLFEQERNLFATERDLWNAERTSLQNQIGTLEQRLARYTNDTQFLSLSSDTSSPSSTQNGSYSSASASFSQPRSGTFGNVSYGPRDSSDTSASIGRKEAHPIWEGAFSRNGSIASRTFDEPTLSPSSAAPPTEFTQAKSTTTNGDKGAESGPSQEHKQSVDISAVDSRLEGIMLKPKAATQATTTQLLQPVPLSAAPHLADGLVSSASELPSSKSSTVTKSALLQVFPDNPNLTKHAGHTPIAALFSAEESGHATPTQSERDPRPSFASRHSQRKDSNPSEDNGDTELKGPLGLLNDGDKDSDFLTKLDSKLLEEAKRIIYSPAESSIAEEEEESDKKLDPEPDIKLRFKKSMNFGSAFGSQTGGKLE